MLRPPGSRLPDFPWDVLAPYRDKATAHPGGIVDLSIGTPVDPTPEPVRAALAAAADAPGYPTTIGTEALREAAARWLARRCGARVDPATEVLPTIGSKELVALLPTLLGAGPGSRVVHPVLAYPTYEVGARFAGATPQACDDVTSVDPAGVALVWLNTPGNPAGTVRSVDDLRRIVAWGRAHGVLVASDECYLEYGWEAEPVSVLHPDVCGPARDGVLAVHSLSKRSNVAGYRAAFVAGGPAVVGALLEVRKHLGMLVPSPMQAAMTVALDDDECVAEQRARYARRRAVLRAALESAGLRIDGSVAGLFLWATRDEDCWETVGWLAERGVLVAPGAFYGAAGARHVRVALTATDERIEVAAARLGG